MISGRGLGATGGTLDKLEAIPGFRTNLSSEEIRRRDRRASAASSPAQPADLVPADRKLYALRDVTGTVPSIPLITASIMSKKLAEGLDALVLDVKYGSGAFMKTREEAHALARSMVDTGRRMGRRHDRAVTDMNQPLGRMAGNAVEVDESVDALKRAGAGRPDGGHARTWRGTALAHEARSIHSTPPGSAPKSDRLRRGLEKFREMVAAQGGDLDAPRPVAPRSEVASPRTAMWRQSIPSARPRHHRTGRRPQEAWR